MRLVSHGGGGAWPGGVRGLPPGPLGGSKSMFGDGSYSGNVMQGGSVLQPVAGVLTITAAATIAPDAVTGAAVLCCDTLVLDGASAALAPSTNSKGLVIYAQTRIQLLNGATCHINALGQAGNFGNLTALDLTPASIRRTLKKGLADVYAVQGEGAAGAAGAVTYADGNTGSAAAAMQTGGGGSGGVNSNGSSASGPGGKGGPCCGGAGSAACVSNFGAYSAPAAGDYGGPGQNAYADDNRIATGGGSGDPVGTGLYGGLSGGGAGGGLLMLIAPVIAIASGCVVSADGAPGVVGSNTYQTGAGGAGGGCVVLVASAGGYSNAGTVRASGGAASTGASHKNGGAGGAGSVNTFTI